MCNVTQRNASELRKIIFTEWNGTQWIISCPHFIPTDNKTEYKCLTVNHTTDKIKCGKHGRKTRDYVYHSAYRCWNCALRHGYARKVEREVLPSSPLVNQPSVLPNINNGIGTQEET